MVALLKERANTVVHLAENARLFYAYENPSPKNLAEHLTGRTRPALKLLQVRLAEIAWDRESLAAAVSALLKETGLKMPELAMAVRLLVTGRTQTPSLDAVLELIGRDAVLARLARHLQAG